jgi:son of sevenless-like protein
LLTFHLFATTEQLFDALVKRFMLAPPEGLTNDEKVLWVDKKLSLIQIRVCNAFKSWIESYWNEELDDAFLDNIFSFVTGPVAKAQPALSTRLQDLLKKRVLFFNSLDRIGYL